MTGNGRLGGTCLWGGSCIVLGSLYPLLLALAELIPDLWGDVPLGDSVALTAGAGSVAIGFGILAFGLRGASIVGGSVWGRSALFVYGAYPFVVRLGALLSAGDVALGGVVSSRIAFAVSVLGLAAGMVAAIAIGGVHAVRGYARWALFPVVAAQSCSLFLLLAPDATTAALSFPVNAAGLALLVAAGVSYALDGRLVAVRRLLLRVVRQW